MKSDSNKVIIGRFGAPFGVKGWIKLISFTDPIENILDYQPWLLQSNQGWRKITLEDGKPHGNTMIVKLSGCDDRDVAQTYTNKEIAIERDQLPPPQANEYYWLDLVGMDVVNKQGEHFGKVSEVTATGANDVLIIKNDNKTTLIPFIKQVIVEVNANKNQIIVDWGIDW